MNHHPALAGHGVSFSRPDERIYPEIRTLCTRRIIEAVGTSGQEYDYKREKWMDKIGWPQGFPSPSRAYIELSKDKPIHHTSIELSPDEEWWDIVVQYFRPESAEELDRSGLKELLGFSVYVLHPVRWLMLQQRSVQGSRGREGTQGYHGNQCSSAST